jgi:hypothetical protein
MEPDSVVCADEESVVYHHGCAIVRYSGDGRDITIVVEGKAISLEYDPVKQRLFLQEYSCIAGASILHVSFPSLSELSGELESSESMPSILRHWLPSLSELESMWRRVRASRHTAGWYDETALFLHALTDLEMVNRLLGMMSLAPVRCVVLNFVGFDGMIGIPAAETDAPLGAVGSVMAKWLPAFAPRQELREVVDTIGAALRPDALHAHVACVHVRMTSCADVVFEKLSKRAPLVIELAYAFLDAYASSIDAFLYTADEGNASKFRHEALLRFLEARDEVASLADVAEVVECAKGLIVDAFEALSSWQALASHGESQPALRVLLCSEIASMLLPIASFLGLVNVTSTTVAFHDQFDFVSRLGCDPLKSLVSRNAAPETDQCAFVLSDACARHADWMFSSTHGSSFPLLWKLTRQSLNLSATFIR